MHRYLQYNNIRVSNREDGGDRADFEGSLHKNTGIYALRIKKRKSIILYIIYIYMEIYYITLYYIARPKAPSKTRLYNIYVYTFNA